MKLLDRIAQHVQRFLFLRNRPLRIRLFVFSFLLVVGPLAAVSAITYHRATGVVQEDDRRYSLQIIEQAMLHLEYYIQDFEIETLKVMNHPEMYRFLRMKTAEEIEQSGIRREIRALLQNASYSRGDIASITVVLDNVQVVDTTESKGLYPATELRKEYWYSQLPANGAPMVISRNVKLEHGEVPVISIIKRLVSPQTLKPIGMLIMDINYSRIQEIAEKVTLGRTGYLYILDAEGHYVYHPDMNMLGHKSEDSELLQHPGNGSRFSEDNRNFLTYSSSSILGWTLVTSVPNQELTQRIKYIRSTMLVTALITLSAAFLVALGFSAGIIGPIKRLHYFMKRVETGDFTGRVEVVSRDEIGLLSMGFNKMAERLSILVEEVYLSKIRETELDLRQRETELKVLQSQMNPHFLYNSLETIRGMALEHEILEIATMSSSLARLLRYNLKNESHTVLLREELGFCELYLRIQKFRFQERFEYRFDVPDWALEQSIAKFSLQPLVENSIIHAMESGTRSILVSVTAERDGDDAFFVDVKDDGGGIPEEILNRISKDLEEKDVLSGGSHIGIVNVHKRIKYLYGSGYGLSMESGPEVGTKVRIRLPYKPA